MTYGRSERQVFMVKGGQAEYCGSRSKYRPDWAGVFRLPDSIAYRPLNILPGETKLSSKWKSQDIRTGKLSYIDLEDEEDNDKHEHKDNTTNKGKDKEVRRSLPEWLKSLRQIFTYCLRSKVRYGYIITDQELFVLRLKAGPEHKPRSARQKAKSISKIEGKDEKSSFDLSADPMVRRAREHGILEYKAIPWSPQSTDFSGHAQTLTVNLALWWLHLMALQDTSIDECYSPLGESEEAQGYGEQFASFTSDTSLVRRRLNDILPSAYNEHDQDFRTFPSKQRKGIKRSQCDQDFPMFPAEQHKGRKRLLGEYDQDFPTLPTEHCKGCKRSPDKYDQDFPTFPIEHRKSRRCSPGEYDSDFPTLPSKERKGRKRSPGNNDKPNRREKWSRGGELMRKDKKR